MFAVRVILILGVFVACGAPVEAVSSVPLRLSAHEANRHSLEGLYLNAIMGA